MFLLILHPCMPQTAYKFNHFAFMPYCLCTFFFLFFVFAFLYGVAILMASSIYSKTMNLATCHLLKYFFTSIVKLLIQNSMTEALKSFEMFLWLGFGNILTPTPPLTHAYNIKIYI